MTLTEFLLARIAEDEAWARAATPGPWRYDSMKVNAMDRGEAVFAGEAGAAAITVASTGPADDFQSMADAAHIAHYDPARVLAECAAKRAIVAIHADGGRTGGWRGDASAEIEHACRTCGEFDEFGVPWPCDTIKALALPYAGHPDYLPEWKP